MCILFSLNSPEEKIKQMEKKVNELIEESCIAYGRGEIRLVRQIILKQAFILIIY